MYLQRFGLNALPFRLSPDPTIYFPCQGQAAPVQALRQVHFARGALTVIAGEHGTGKTLLLQRLLSELPASTAIARFQRGPSALAELLESLARQLAGDAQRSTARSAIDIEAALDTRESRGQHTVIAIDDADVASDRTIAELLERTTDRFRKVDVVMTGDPTLPSRVHRLVNVAPVPPSVATIDALAAGELEAYLQLRLDRAGAGGRAFFDTAATQLLMRISNGLPKLVNRLADGGLSAACEAMQETVRSEDVLSAARFLGTVDSAHSRRAVPTVPVSAPANENPVLETTSPDLGAATQPARTPGTPSPAARETVMPIQGRRDASGRRPAVAAKPTLCRIHLQQHGVVLGSIDLVAGACDVGRSRSNDLHIPSRYVSRVHCRIHREADRILIEDLGSTNGLRLRGESLRLGSLLHGDVIAIGTHELRIEIVPLDG